MERGVPGDPPLGPWKISTNCFYMLVKLCTYLPLKCNISGQMDLIFWHSLHLHPAHFFIFQGCFYFVEAVGPPDSFRLWTRCGTWDCSSTTLFFFCVQFAIWLWFNTYDTNFWWFFGMNIHKSPDFLVFWLFWASPYFEEDGLQVAPVGRCDKVSLPLHQVTTLAASFSTMSRECLRNVQHSSAIHLKLSTWVLPWLSGNSIPLMLKHSGKWSQIRVDPPPNHVSGYFWGVLNIGGRSQSTDGLPSSISLSVTRWSPVRATSSGHPPPLVAAWVEGALEKLQAQMSWLVVDRALQETMATNLASNQHVSDAWQMPMMFADGFF